jgi:hypothetical protein
MSGQRIRLAPLTGNTADDQYAISAGTGQSIPVTGTTGGALGAATTAFPILAGGPPYNVSAGSSDNTAALNAAFLAAKHGTCILPPGNLIHLSALTADSCNIFGAGVDATTLSCTTQLGGTTPALLHTETDGKAYHLERFSMSGPSAGVLGTRTANCYGLQLNSSSYVAQLHITRFDAGLVVNSPYGHVYGNDLNITNNYYGIYFSKNASDYHFADCTINGNMFANIATPADQGIASARFDRCHLGYGPYGVYQEALPANQGNKVFLSEVTFQDSRFEQIGNAAIWSDAQDDSSNHSGFTDILISNPGFSWADGIPGGSPWATNPACPASYAIRVTSTGRNIKIVDGPFPFLAGLTSPTIAQSAASAGIFHAVSAGHISWTRVSAAVSNGGAPTDLTIDSGGLNYYYGQRELTSYDLPSAATVFGNSLNLLASDDASFELTIGGWAVGANCTIARSSAQAADGSNSLAMTSVASGLMNAALNSAQRPAVIAGQTYSAHAKFLTAATAQSCRVILNFYNSGGTGIGTTNATLVTDATGAWVSSSCSAVAPAGAVKAGLVVQVQTTAGASEIHYVDCAGIFEGTTNFWESSPPPVIKQGASGDVIVSGGGGGVNGKGLVTVDLSSAAQTALAGAASGAIIALCGDASDGALVFDGTTTIAGLVPAATVYTLTRDLFASTLTVNSGVTIITAGFRLFATTSVTNGGTLSCNGGAGAAIGTAGAGVVPGNYAFGQGPGGAGNTGAGTGPSFGSAASMLSSSGGAGGAGGLGTGGAGGAGATQGSGPSGNAGLSNFRNPITLQSGIASIGQAPKVLAGGAGGGGGGGDATNKGGGGGAGGGIIVIFSPTVTNTGTISATGGNGGSPATGNCGGGGAGGGGLIAVYTSTAWTAGTTVVTHGTGGTAVGSGVNGGSGANGFVLNVIL